MLVRNHQTAFRSLAGMVTGISVRRGMRTGGPIRFSRSRAARELLPEEKEPHAQQHNQRKNFLGHSPGVALEEKGEGAGENVDYVGQQQGVDDFCPGLAGADAQAEANVHGQHQDDGKQRRPEYLPQRGIGVTRRADGLRQEEIEHW